MTQTITPVAAKAAREAKAYATDGAGHVFCVEYYGTQRRRDEGRACDNGVGYDYLQGLARDGWTVYVAKCPIRAAHTLYPGA